jgi:hypothetical protein
MGTLEKLSSMRGRPDDIPNEELAQWLSYNDSTEGIRELINALKEHQSTAVQSDCVKVLYEVGYRSPELIAPYVDDFLEAIKSKNNRIVWGAMIALSTVAGLRAERIFDALDAIIEVMKGGSVITMDNGVKVLGLVAGHSEDYCRRIFPYLIGHLDSCRQRDLPQHAEHVLPAVNARNRGDFVRAVGARMTGATEAQKMRLTKLLKKVDSMCVAPIDVPKQSR